MADPNKMLIDATHPEETRVVVLRGGRVEEFDYESAARKQLRGNIYLAKVTRVEPSLQAAFVDYGGNRHGFLAFNEIHPDYYQIPVADRQALIEEEAAAEAAEEAAAEARAEARARREAQRAASRAQRQASTGGSDPSSHEEDDDEDDDDVDEVTDLQNDIAAEPVEDANDDEEADEEHVTRAEASGLAAERLTEDLPDAGPDSGPDAGTKGASANETGGQQPIGAAGTTAMSNATGDDDADLDRDSPRPHGLVEDEGVRDVATPPANGEAEESVEQVGSEDALEELPSRPRRRMRSYKIQEVIKRRQVVLVQVVKEERGNKGAALTTYLSLAGRYTVLMPNTARGGGISRKITQPQDRKRLKAIAAELDVPEGMGLIIRTAGAARTKQEIKRDFEYLLRLWESVRELTLQSTAPSLVYEEGNLIKRSIRDLYNKDVEEIIVAGDDAHREAKDFMRMLMPSHAKNVIQYQQPEPLFTRFQIERQLNAMFSPYVTLRSGGYLVINQTEALVAIDVNSGKATREFSIEETALVTNCEAADEIARQLKLRDLAGLIVIDFIDMEEKRNNRTVERRIKEALKHDRARIQVGRISHFGLLEMSRQRLRTGVLEGSTSQCPHCQGTGIIRSVESVALAVLRGLEDAVMAGNRTSLTAVTTPTVALYILNKKRTFIIDMEGRHGLPIMVEGSEKMQGANFSIEKGPAPAQHHRRPEKTAVNMDWGFGEDEDDTSIEDEAEEIVAESTHREERGERRDRGERDRGERDRGEGERRDRGDADGDGRRRRRRRRRGRRDDRDMRTGDAEAAFDRRDAGDDDDAGMDSEPSDTDDAVEAAADAAPAKDEAQHEGDGEGGQRRRRRRGRRGGRRNRERTGQTGSVEAAEYGEHAHDEDVDDDGGTGPAEDPVDAKAMDPLWSQPDAGAVPREDAIVGHAGSASRDDTAPEKRMGREAERNSHELSSSEVPEPRAPRGEQAPASPRIERVVVATENAGGEAASPDAAEGPSRKGWWQRRFGS